MISFKNKDYSPFLIFVLTFLFYLKTLAPAFLWSDSSKLCLFVRNKEIFNFSHGIHPAHTVLGILFSYLPLDLAYSQNLMSAFFSSIALALFYILCKALIGSPKVAFITSLLLAVSHTFWLYSVINETYSLLIFFLVSTLLLAIKANHSNKVIYLIFSMILMGFSILNHSISIIFIPGILLIFYNKGFFRSNRINIFLLLIVFFVISIIPLIFLLLIKSGPALVFKTLYRDTIYHFKTYFNLSKSPKEIFLYPLYLFYQFPGVGFLLGLIGIPNFCKYNKRIFFGFSSIFVFDILFSSAYFLQRQFALLLPSYLIFSVFIGFGFRYLLDYFRGIFYKENYSKISYYLISIILIFFPLMLYYSFPTINEYLNLNIIKIRKLPYRDNIRYFFVPDKSKEYGALNYSKEVFEEVEPNSIILIDFNPGMALLYYQQIYKKREDLEIAILIDNFVHSYKNPEKEIHKFIEKNIDKRPIYLGDKWEEYYFLNYLKKFYELEPVGSIIKVNKK